jgi:iron complex transport system ATP-binding protein
MEHGDALRLTRLTAGYGKRDVITDLTLPPLRPGEIVALLGPNGCGKSTLLKALAGILPLHGGAVLLGADDLARMDMAERARRVAYLPQEFPAAVHLRVLESILVAAHAHGGLRQRADPGAADTLLKRLDIAGLAMRFLDELSGGQRQLAGLAQALVRNPRVLLLDEPLSALDLSHQLTVMALLRRETEMRRLITVVVLHDLNVALRHADRVVMLHDGRVAADGAPMEAVDPPALARVYGVRARVERCSQGIAHVMVDGLLASGAATDDPGSETAAAPPARRD